MKQLCNLSILLLALLLYFWQKPIMAFEWSGKLQKDIEELKSSKSKDRLEALRRLARHPVNLTRKYILKALKDNDLLVQREAARIAAEKNIRDAGPVLLTWLSHSNQALRMTAAYGLGELGNPKSIKPLARALSDPEPKVRLKVVEALSKIHSSKNQEVVPLIGRLNDSNSKVRLAIINVLAEKQDRRSVPPLMAKLNDSAREVRVAAILALGEIGDPGAGPVLVRLIRDPLHKVASAAITTLGKIHYTPATEPLIDIFKNGSFVYREVVATALAMLSNPLAIQALIDGLFQSHLRKHAQTALTRVADKAFPALKKLLLDPRTPRAVAAAAVHIIHKARLKGAVPLLIQHLRLGRLPMKPLIQALGSIGDPRAQKPLLEILDHPSNAVKYAALSALNNIIDERAASPLLRLLNKSEVKMQRKIIVYLGRLHASVAVSALSKMTRKKDLQLARLATQALSEIHSKKSIPNLLSLLSHKDRTLRRYAALALTRIHDLSAVPSLLKLCQISKGSVQVTCLQTLGGVLRNRTHEKALALLKSILEGSDHAAKLASLDALNAMRDSNIAAMLVKLYPKFSIDLQKKTLDALGKIKSEVKLVLPIISKALQKKNPMLSSTAAWAFGQLGPNEQLPLIIEATRSSNWLVRTNAAAALTRLNRAKVKSVFLRLVKDPSAYVRANAVLGLSNGKDKKTLLLLSEKVFRDQSPWVRINALRILKILAPQKIRGPDGKSQMSIEKVNQWLIKQDIDERVRWIAKELQSQKPIAPSSSWLSLLLLDYQRNPIKNKPFILVTPSGLVKVDFTNYLGEAWVEDLPPGVCFSELPPPAVITLSKN